MSGSPHRHLRLALDLEQLRATDILTTACRPCQAIDFVAIDVRYGSLGDRCAREDSNDCDWKGKNRDLLIISRVKGCRPAKADVDRQVIDVL